MSCSPCQLSCPVAPEAARPAHVVYPGRDRRRVCYTLLTAVQTASTPPFPLRFDNHHGASRPVSVWLSTATEQALNAKVQRNKLTRTAVLRSLVDAYLAGINVAPEI